MKTRATVIILLLSTACASLAAPPPPREPFFPASHDPTTLPTTRAWGIETDGQRERSVDQLKRRAERYQSMTDVTLTPFETKFFLFYSDLPAVEATRWTNALDRMYARLAELFGIPRDQNIWRGKALVIVFKDRAKFVKFENDAFHIAARTFVGFCHQQGDGNVVIVFQRTANPLEFGSVLTHESTHGFLYRYRSTVHIVSWANEGLADAIAWELVPRPGLKQSQDALARNTLRKPDALRDFFDAKQIDPSQYPVARSLCEFMIRQDKQRYVEFINGMKDGLSWEDSLEQKYGVTVEQLLRAYGQTMGVPGLTRP